MIRINPKFKTELKEFIDCLKMERKDLKKRERQIVARINQLEHIYTSTDENLIQLFEDIDNIRQIKR